MTLFGNMVFTEVINLKRGPIQANEWQRLSANNEKLGERDGTDSPSQPSEGTTPIDTLILDC